MVARGREACFGQRSELTKKDVLCCSSQEICKNATDDQENLRAKSGPGLDAVQPGK